MLIATILVSLVGAPWFFKPALNETQIWAIEMPTAQLRDTAFVVFSETSPNVFEVTESLGREPLYRSTSVFQYGDHLGLNWVATRGSCDSAETRNKLVCNAIDSLPRKNLTFTLIGNIGSGYSKASESHDTACSGLLRISINIKVVCFVRAETTTTASGTKILTRHDYGENDAPLYGVFDTTRFDEQGRCLYASRGWFENKYSFWNYDSTAHVILRATRLLDLEPTFVAPRRKGPTSLPPPFRDLDEMYSWFRASGITIHAVTTISGRRIPTQHRPQMVILRTNQGTRRAMIGIGHR